MGLRVVSTKLTEEEHSKLLDVCSKKGCTPSALVKEAIMEKIQPHEDIQSQKKNLDEMTLEELCEAVLQDEKKK